MKHPSPANVAVDELVERFVEIALAQDKALLYDDTRTFNTLYRQMDSIINELKHRPGDERHVLMRLYRHSNMQVRLKAALSTLPIEPLRARAMLQAIAESGWQPQCADAGMALWNLDRGVFKPT